MGSHCVGVLVAAIAVSVMAGIGYFGKRYEVPRRQNTFTYMCKYDTTVLCANCFKEPTDCSIFGGEIYTEMDKFEFINEFERHSMRMGAVNDTDEPVLIFNNLNRNFALELLRNSVCDEFDDAKACDWSNEEKYIQVLRRRVLDDNRSEGVIFCPSGDEGALTRFVGTFHDKELLTLLLIATNSQSFMVRLGMLHNLPLPYFVMQRGFTLVELYEGQPLSSFYQSPLPLRLKIAIATIDAFLRFNAGVYNFRFYLTNMGPENIFVNVPPEENVQITFTELSSVVIIDEKDGIYSDRCTNKYGDMNLHTACQVLLEYVITNTEKGFLNNTKDALDLGIVREKLHHCVYCEAPDCTDRQLILENIQLLLTSILSNDD